MKTIYAIAIITAAIGACFPMSAAAQFHTIGSKQVKADFHLVNEPKIIETEELVYYDYEEEFPDEDLTDSPLYDTYDPMEESLANIDLDMLLNITSLPLKSIYVTSPYGMRNDPKTGKKRFHNGVDLRAQFEPVYAMMAGTVDKVGEDNLSGKYITLRHGDELTVSYCHLSKIYVNKGDFIFGSIQVGVSGNTGRSTGPHLHLTIKYNGKPIDALQFIDVIKNDIEGATAQNAD